MLRDVLCALGLAACPPSPPDVSAHTILNMLTQTQGQAEFLIPALGSLYEDVTVRSQTTNTEIGLEFLIVEFGRGGPSLGSLRCDTVRDPDAVATKRLGAFDNPKYQAALLEPWNRETEHRTTCVFNYTDTASRVDGFTQQAEIWAEHQIGPLSNDSGQRSKNARFASSDVKGLAFSVLDAPAPNGKTSVLLIKMDISAP